MNKPLFLFVGPSGSGKTTTADFLEEKYGYKQLQSYTTRHKRYADESGHIFITEKEFDSLKNIVAYNKYNGSRYCATEEQVEEADIYVIDVPGIEDLLQKYKNTSRPIYIIYFDSTVKTRIDRMYERGDHDAAILSRLHNDEAYDWLKKIDKIILNTKRHVWLYAVDANKNKSDVIDETLFYMR